MTVTQAIVKSNKAMRDSFLAAGWLNGDEVTSYSKSKPYFFHYIVIKDKLVTNQSPIRNLFAVWGVNSVDSVGMADDSYRLQSSTIYATFNIADPVTDDKLTSSVGNVESEMLRRGWKMSLMSASDYDDANKLRNIQVSFTKSLSDEDEE